MPSHRKIVSRAEAASRAAGIRAGGAVVVFTNGCFDLLHAGHAAYLYEAKAAGDFLVVGLNSDASVRRCKGPARPIVRQDERAELLAALEMVDLVSIFDEDTPLELIRSVQPNVIVKGADWSPENVVGWNEVEARGGRLLLVPLRTGCSTTSILERARSSPSED